MWQLTQWSAGRLQQPRNSRDLYLVDAKAGHILTRRKIAEKGRIVRYIKLALNHGMTVVAVKSNQVESMMHALAVVREPYEDAATI